MSDILESPIRTQSDLHDLWRALVQPLGWHRRELWSLVIDDDDEPVRELSQLIDLPGELDETASARLASVMGEQLEGFPGGRIALLWCRPGLGPIRATDRRTAARVYAALAAAGVSTDVIHLATDDDIVPLPVDEMGAALDA